MATNAPSERKLREIEEMAAGWGKLPARHSFPEEPGFDVRLANIEDIVARAIGAIVREAVAHGEVAPISVRNVGYSRGGKAGQTLTARPPGRGITIRQPKKSWRRLASWCLRPER